jgi:hypothetical protein
LRQNRSRRSRMAGSARSRWKRNSEFGFFRGSRSRFRLFSGTPYRPPGWWGIGVLAFAHRAGGREQRSAVTCHQVTKLTVLLRRVAARAFRVGSLSKWRRTCLDIRGTIFVFELVSNGPIHRVNSRAKAMLPEIRIVKS